MAREKIKIAFNADTMTVRDLKACADALETIFRAYDRQMVEDKSGTKLKEALAEVGVTVMQYRDGFEL